MSPEVSRFFHRDEVVSTSVTVDVQSYIDPPKDGSWSPFIPKHKLAQAVSAYSQSLTNGDVALRADSPEMRGFSVEQMTLKEYRKHCPVMAEECAAWFERKFGTPMGSRHNAAVRLKRGIYIEPWAEKHLVLYEHFDPKTGLVYYVGEGLPDRPYSMSRYPDHKDWMVEMQSAGYKIHEFVHILETGIPTKRESLKREAARINLQKNSGMPLFNRKEL